MRERVADAVRAELHGTRIAARVDYRELAGELASAMCGSAFWQNVIGQSADRKAAAVKAARRAVKHNAGDAALAQAKAVLCEAVERSGMWLGDGDDPMGEPAVQDAMRQIQEAGEQELAARRAEAQEALQKAQAAVLALMAASPEPPRHESVGVIHPPPLQHHVHDWLDATREILHTVHEPPRRTPRASEALQGLVIAAAAVWLRYLGEIPAAGGASPFTRAVQAAVQILSPKHSASPATIRSILRASEATIQSQAALQAATLEKVNPAP
jgi:hypothetical protein